VEWTLDERSDGLRLDVFLSECAGVTRSRAASIIKSGGAWVNEKVETKAGFMLKAGMRVRFEVPEVQPPTAMPQEIPLDIRYQDRDLAVIYKPCGMVVHPAAGNHDGTLVNALLHHLTDLSGIGGALRPGIVHRIDKDTSGLLLVAKNDFSHSALSEQIKAHTVERAYLAIVTGNLKEDSGSVDGPIGRHPTDRKRMAIVPGGRSAHTDWRVLKRLRGATLIEATLTTGRTHQIRVHMASIGHPVLGDPVYGPKKPQIAVSGGQLLHAFRLGFVHPSTGEHMRFEAPPEKRFLEVLEKLSI